MAGSYPDAPSERIAYDEDGTVMWRAQTIGGAVFGGGGTFTAMVLPPTEQSSTQKQEYNDEDTTIVFSAGGPAAVDYGFAWVFPEKRDVFGFYGYATQGNTGLIEDIDSSTDTKNGVTGNFTVHADREGDGGLPVLVQPPGNNNWSVQQSYREFIHGFTSTGVRSVRARFVTDKTVGGATDIGQVAAFHWYGTIASSVNPDRLIFIEDNTGLAYDEVQDWGDIPRGSVHDKKIYLYNNSATLSASSNVMTFEALTGDSNTWYTIRDDSSTSTGFSTSLTVDGPIAPGTRYPASTSITVRLTVADDENLGPAAARLQLATGTWST